ncbi:NRDE family protein [Pseudomonas sp. 5P_3.1_Bac2]|uniref:NRDE family protein n=1 Tax=Pseudomonas sp. 5P_3.1_Bac2 TaxID=2971617 RepID=UPI0021CA16CB|nr:NRDE family protein [Pseudomonas sp. 5P_3.1_Bac2]MCU1718494.1 NRDE family protein [Pseudomonas sp. 5P_3.1_Bac2]
MCLIVFAWRPGHALPLLVAANRDEFYARPSQAAAPWPEAPGIIAGRDLQAGGTWLGIGPNGRFAALTNIRDPSLALGQRSRGELAANFLRGGHNPAEFLRDLSQQRQHYSGFNLLLGDAQQLWHFNSHSAEIRCLPAGLYGLSNDDLDTPWPKLQRAKADLATCLAKPSSSALLQLLHNPQPAADELLPDTGVGLPTERLLSSVFIHSDAYGTRASTSVIVHSDGRRELTERSFASHGEFIAEVQWQG